jgi:hypothetical protein
MQFQPGQSGNPAGRPPDSLNKKTLGLQEAFEAKAEEIVDDVIARAKNGQPTAMRLVMERAVPIGRNRRFPIDLPVIKTPDDARAAMGVVTAELAAGKLSVNDASSLILLVERMLRLAERIWKMRRAEQEAEETDARAALLAAVAAELDADAEHDRAVPAAAAAAKSAGASGERLYSPVNQGTQAPAERPGLRGDRPAPSAGGETVPHAKAA